MAQIEYSLSFIFGGALSLSSGDNISITIGGSTFNIGPMSLNQNAAIKYESGAPFAPAPFSFVDIGQITGVVLNFQKKGTTSEKWNITQLVIQKNGEVYRFQDTQVPAGQEVTLAPTRSTEKNYHVQITTSSGMGSGTDSPVWMGITAANGNIPEIVLPQSAGSFEAGQTDDIPLTVADLGQISSITLGLKSSGKMITDNWKVGFVRIIIDTGAFVFDCQNSEIAEGKSKTFTLTRFDPIETYEVWITTSAKPGANTDDQVWISIKGTTGATRQTLLLTAGGGGTQKTSIHWVNVGELSEITLGTIRSGSSADNWIVSKVEISAAGLFYGFVTKETEIVPDKPQKFAAAKIPKLSSQPTTIPSTSATPTQPTPTQPAPTQPTPTQPTPTQPTPTQPTPTQPTPTQPTPTQPTPTQPAPTQPAPTQPAPTQPAPTQPTPTQPTTQPTPTPQGPPIKYKVDVTTSNNMFSGTDDNVWINLKGANGESGKQVFTQNKGQFETGKTDSFPLDLPDLGDLNSIILGLDKVGGDDWRVAKVQISDPRSVYLFDCKNTEIKSATSATFALTSKSALTSTPSATSASITPAQPASTPAQPAPTPAQPAPTPAQPAPTPAQPASVQPTPSVPPKATPTSTPTSAPTQTPSQTPTPTPTPTTTTTTPQTQTTVPSTSTGSGPTVPYQVTIGLGAPYSVTADQVFVILKGKKGETIKGQLKSTKTVWDIQKPEVFSLQLVDVGDLETVTLGTDKSGFSGDVLRVARIDIQDSKNLYWVNCNNTEIPSGKSQTFTLSYGSSSPNPSNVSVSTPSSGVIKYVFSVTTSKESFSGTDDEVWFNLTGKKNSVTNFKFPSETRNFEQGKTDRFDLDLSDLGELVQLTLGSNKKSTFGDDWKVSRVEINDSRNLYTFECQEAVIKPGPSGTKTFTPTKVTALSTPAVPSSSTSSPSPSASSSTPTGPTSVVPGPSNTNTASTPAPSSQSIPTTTTTTTTTTATTKSSGSPSTGLSDPVGVTSQGSKVQAPSTVVAPLNPQLRTMSSDGVGKVQQFFRDRSCVLSSTDVQDLDALLSQPDVLKVSTSTGPTGTEYEKLVYEVINDNNQQRQLTFLHGLLCTIYLILAILIVILTLRAYGKLSSLKVVLEPWEPTLEHFDFLTNYNF